MVFFGVIHTFSTMNKIYLLESVFNCCVSQLHPKPPNPLDWEILKNFTATFTCTAGKCFVVRIRVFVGVSL